MTQKKESALGRGLDALIRREPLEEVKEPVSTPSKKKTREIPKSKTRSKKNTKKPIKGVKDNSAGNPMVSEDLVNSVLLEVHKNPRISLWSARSAAVLRLLKKTKPEFSISKESSALIEAAVKEKYPDLWEIFEDENV